MGSLTVARVAGVPLTVPSVASVSPGGSLPLTSVNAYAEVPPLAVRLCV